MFEKSIKNFKIFANFLFFSLQEHEKTCQEDDDVIFCGEEFLVNSIDKQLKPQSDFLQNFSLFNPMLPLPNPKTPTKKNAEQSSSNGKQRRKPRCSQIVLSTNIPFSSPAGQQLLKLSKSYLDRSYVQEKMDRYERYCCAPPLTDNNLSNWLKPTKYNRIPITYRRPQEQTYRWYQFPRRQIYKRWHRQAFLNLNINELKLCKPVTVKLKKLTHSDIEAFHSENRHKELMKMGNMMKSNLDDRSIIVDVIDLCSDDDEISNDNVTLHHDSENVSQTAITPASKLSPSFIEPLQMYTRTSSQAPVSMFSSDENFQYENHENHQSFLKGAQGSIVTQIDKLTDLDGISIQTQCIPSVSQAHISIDLTL